MLRLKVYSGQGYNKVVRWFRGGDGEFCEVFRLYDSEDSKVVRW